MKWLILALCFAPTIIEAILDRFGETRKGKRKDFIWLSLVALALVGASWRLGYNPLAVLLLLLVIRFAVFDYLVHWFLKRYSENHGHINIWQYTGKSTHWHDQIAAKVHPVLRLVIRVVILVLSVAYYTI